MGKLYKELYLLHCLRKYQEIKAEKIINVICIHFKKSIHKLHIQILISSLVKLVESPDFVPQNNLMLYILFDSEPNQVKEFSSFLLN